MHYPKSTAAQTWSEPYVIQFRSDSFIRKNKLKKQKQKQNGITIPSEHVQHGGEKKEQRY